MARSKAADSQRRLEGILASAMDAIIAVDDRQRIVLFNPAAEQMFGCPVAEAMGQLITRFIPVRHRAGHEAHIGRFRATGVTNRKMGSLGAVSGLRSNGEEFLLEASISQAQVGGEWLATVILRDITERTGVLEALGGARRRLEGIVESAMDAIITVDESHRIVLFNPAAERMFGVSGDEAMGETLTRFIPVRLRKDHDEHIRRFTETGVTNRKMGALGAVSGLRANGEEFPLEASISHISIGGERLGTVILRDITERRTNEDARHLLSREVDHRSKNVLAVAQALVTMTRADSKEEFARAVQGRIAALARAHSLLSESRWQGAELKQTIESELAPYVKPGQTNLAGPPVMLRASAVQPISLVMHELATNACKYGALKNEGGVVDVHWQVDLDGFLSLYWLESGGPEVRPPERSGFGSVLLNQVVHRQLEGKFLVEWDPAGIRICLVLPPGKFILERRTQDGERLEPWRWALAGAGDVLLDPQILVVEDDALIALELETELARFGWKIVGPAMSLQEGLNLAEHGHPLNAAVLDVNLNGRLVYPLAQKLQDLGIPFVFCTGYDVVDPDGRSRDVPVMHKPIDMVLLDRQLSTLAGRASPPDPVGATA